MGLVTTNGDSSVEADVTAWASAGGSGRHRRPGPAAIDDPTPSFPKVLLENPREPAMVLLGGLAGLAWGMSTAIAPGPMLRHALGEGAAVAGLLVLVSYLLRFFPAALHGEDWSRTRPRRALRLLLKCAWGVFLGCALLAWVAGLFAGH